MLDFLVRRLIGWMWAPAMRRTLGRQLDKSGRRALLDSVRRGYMRLSREIPHEPTVGARLMLRMSALTVASYQGLRELGWDERAAVDATTRVNWWLYEKIAAPAWWTTRLRSRDRLRRMKRAMDLFMRFPYAAPGYQMQYVDAGPRCVGFDVRRCPAAEYFAAQGLSSLCTQAFCDLDYPLAERWGVALSRPGTIARGATHCDFRYRHVGEQEPDTPAAQDVAVKRSS